MDRQFLGYLKKTVELEQAVYTQKQVIAKLDYEISRLGHLSNFQEPKPPAEPSPALLDTLGSFIGSGAMIGFFVGIFNGSFLGGIVPGAVIGGLVNLVLNAIVMSSESTKRHERYYAAMREYKANMEWDIARVNAEYAQKEKLEELRDIMASRLKETTSILNKYYDTDIIFPKYRNLVALCSIYEYFLSGRCSKLTGHGGAYDTYEYDARMNLIIVKLDEIINQLETIKNNQYMLYDAIQEGN